MAVGRSYDPAFNIGFMKSFEMRKLKIANFNAPEDGIHTLMEKGNSGVFCPIGVPEFLYITIAKLTSTFVQSLHENAKGSHKTYNALTSAL